MKSCKNCVFWSTHHLVAMAKNPMHALSFTDDFGLCLKNIEPSNNDGMYFFDQQKDLLMSNYSPETRKLIYTEPNFACVKHEPKD